MDRIKECIRAVEQLRVTDTQDNVIDTINLLLKTLHYAGEVQDCYYDEIGLIHEILEASNIDEWTSMPLKSRADCLKGIRAIIE